MNHLMKRTVMVLMALIILLGVNGCMKKKPDPEAIKTEMMTYLNNKYGEEFVPLSLSLSSFAYSYDSLRAYPKNGTEQEAFEVWGTRMEDGSYQMSDGYFGIYIRPQYEAAMSKLVGEVYKDFKLYTTFGEGVLPDRLNKTTKLEEIYSKDEHFSTDTVIFVKQSSASAAVGDLETNLRKIAGKMREHKFVGFVQVFVVLDNKYESIGPEVLHMSTLQDKEYFLDKPKSIMVTPELKIRQNGEEVVTHG